MKPQIRVNPNFEGDSKLILKLFGDGIENGALLHKQLIGRAYSNLGNLEDAEDTVQDFYLDFSRRVGQKGYLTFELTKDLDVNTHEGFRRLAQGSFSKYLIDKYRTASRTVRKIKLESELCNKNNEFEYSRLKIFSKDYPETYAINREEAYILKYRIDQLPEKEREVIILHYEQGLTIRETSERLGTLNGTVKTKLFRGL